MAILAIWQYIWVYIYIYIFVCSRCSWWCSSWRLDERPRRSIATIRRLVSFSCPGLPVSPTYCSLIVAYIYAWDHWMYIIIIVHWTDDPCVWPQTMENMKDPKIQNYVNSQNCQKWYFHQNWKYDFTPKCTFTIFEMFKKLGFCMFFVCLRVV